MRKLFLLVMLTTLLTGCYGRFEPYTTPILTVGSEGAQVPDCKPYDTSSIAPAELGCFVESSRWQMMVHPENMLKDTDKVSTTR